MSYQISLHLLRTSALYLGSPPLAQSLCQLCHHLKKQQFFFFFPSEMVQFKVRDVQHHDSIDQRTVETPIKVDAYKDRRHINLNNEHTIRVSLKSIAYHKNTGFVG